MNKPLRLVGNVCHDTARLEPMTLCYMGRPLDHYTIYCYFVFSCHIIYHLLSSSLSLSRSRYLSLSPLLCPTETMFFVIVGTCNAFINFPFCPMWFNGTSPTCSMVCRVSSSVSTTPNFSSFSKYENYSSWLIILSRLVLKQREN